MKIDICDAKRLLLLFCIEVTCRGIGLHAPEGLVDEIANANESKVKDYYSRIFITGDIKLKSNRNDTDVAVDDISIDAKGAFCSYGEYQKVRDIYCLLDKYGRNSIMFSKFCFALANILFRDEFVERISGLTNNPDLAGLHKQFESFSMRADVGAFNILYYNKIHSMIQFGVDEEERPIVISQTAYVEQITDKPSLNSLSEIMQKKISALFEPKPEATVASVLEEQKFDTPPSKFFVIALSLLSLGGLFLMFATIFPNAFAFINFPHLINNAFLGCVIPSGIVGGISFIFLAAKAICNIFFRDVILQAAEKDSKSAIFSCKVFCIYPSDERLSTIDANKYR
jgi:hypothetical protein